MYANTHNQAGIPWDDDNQLGIFGIALPSIGGLVLKGAKFVGGKIIGGGGQEVPPGEIIEMRTALPGELPLTQAQVDEILRTARARVSTTPPAPAPTPALALAGFGGGMLPLLIGGGLLVALMMRRR